MRSTKLWEGLLAAALAFGAAVSAAYGVTATVGGVTWSYSVTNGNATVTGANVAGGNLSIPSSLGGCPVTSIGDEAFEECFRELPTTVTIPSSVTNIGAYAFHRCRRLSMVTIPSSVRTIGPYAFYACSELATVEIPSSVEEIGWGAFSGCSEMTSITVATGNSHYSSKDDVLFTKAGNGLICFPAGKTSSYSIPSGVDWIYQQAFDNCHGLGEVTFPSGLASIGWHAFSGCDGLTTLTLPSSVESIDGGAFADCYGLTAVTIRGNAENYLGSSLFSGCDNLRTLSVPESWKSRYVDGEFWSSHVEVPEECTIIYGEAALVLEAASQHFTAYGGSGNTLGVTANQPWTARSSVDWLTVKTASGSANGTIVYDVAENWKTDNRTGTITVTGGGLTRTFTVTQDGNGPFLVVDGGFVGYTASAAYNQSLKVFANVPWTVNSSDWWLTVYEWERSDGSWVGTIWYDVEENTGTSDRTGTITVTGGGQVRTFTVTQAGVELVLSEDGRSFAPTGGSGQELGVTANVSWSAWSVESWLRVYTWDGTIWYDVEEHTGTMARTGTITVTGGGITRTFMVTQEAPEMVLSADGRSFTMAAATGQELGVTANVPWTAESDAAWLTVNTASGSGNGAIRYDVAANMETEVRTGTITVTGLGITRTFTVTQAAPVLELSADGRSFTMAAAIGQELGVTANVAWRAESDAAWLVLETGNGSGNGTIVYDVAEHTGTAGRTGTITVAGWGITRTFMVTQEKLEQGVTFMGNGGTPERQTGVYCIGETYGSLPSATWEGHAFAGWWTAPRGGTQVSTESTVSPDSTRTLYAHWLEANPNLSITPSARHFGKDGGIYAIVTSGSGSWAAAASDSWITLNAASGQAGYPVAYAVSLTAQAESRTGIVYVSGLEHTVTQDGLGGSISPTNATFTMAGGTGTIQVTVGDGVAWRAKSDCDWVNVSQTGRTGAGSVPFEVEPLAEIVTRQGMLTVAGQTFTVVQNGLPMAISPRSAEHDYLEHTVSITVEALSITKWGVTTSASWISVVDKGSGKGNGTVTLAIAENPSWRGRSGTVKIGTETFTVTQGGRTALVFDISPATATANVAGSNGKITVTATPDLPWSAKSQATWLTLSGTTNGAGNGNVSYTAAANPTLYDRTGKMVVTPGDSNVSTKTLTVTQPAATSALSVDGYEFEAAGGSFELSVSVADNVQWSIENTNTWLTVAGAKSRVGPGTVTLQAATNKTVLPRSGTLAIARKAFNVSQKAQGVEVEYDRKVFGTDGGSDSLSIRAEAGASWTAVVSDKTWITIFGSDSGAGTGEIMYIVSQYVGDGMGRAGSITVGDKVVRIVQFAQETEQVFPDVRNAADVAVVLATAADRRLEKEIRSVEEYEALRAWVAERGLDKQAVKNSPHTWMAFVLGAKRLPENEPTIQIDGLAIKHGDMDGAGNGTTMDVSVTVKDGEREMAVDAETVAGLFESTDDLDDWAAWATLATTAMRTGNDGATMHFNVIPCNEMAHRAFLRLVPKTPQTISFESIGAQTVENQVKLSATATSGRTVVFEVVSGPGVIDGDVLSFTGTGTVEVRAVQNGNKWWRPASASQSVVVVADETEMLYMVVDLSAGSMEGAVYPVSYRVAEPVGGWTDEYKTTKLVLRRIPAGTFTMGSPTNELGKYDDEEQHEVTLSKPFYMGVFEVTQRQWELVMGSNPSRFSGDKRPVERVSWDTIRGNGGWPSSSAVSADSFMGRLRAWTGLGDFDLPTEAQWEYACRAGTTTAYSYGASANGDYMWYTSNSLSQTHEVGTKKANPWGLYDMHGNVWEWCLDWYMSNIGTAAVTDPKGASSGSGRVLRGGGWGGDAAFCRSAYRYDYYPSGAYDYLGFRLSRILSE